jgi:tRNA pseudouridine55 synthase
MNSDSRAFHGLLAVDKPVGMTSREAVDRVKGWFPRKTRVGHTGTLDPLASGILVVCVGAAVRFAEFIQRMEKTYFAGIRLGVRSNTDDAEGKVIQVANPAVPDDSRVEECLRHFVGEIQQTPPAFSAAKVAGRRAYQLARHGQEVSLAPRRVQIKAITLLRFAFPRLDIEVRCGKGTYIRSLARDLGETLGCGAILEELRRTRVGVFDDGSAVKLSEPVDQARLHLLPVHMAVAGLPSIQVLDTDLQRLRQGQRVSVKATATNLSTAEQAFEVAIFDAEQSFVGVGVFDERAGELAPRKLMPIPVS